MQELANLAEHLRIARRADEAAAERVKAHILADGERRLLAYLEARTWPFQTCTTRAWYEAHNSDEVYRLGDLRQAARDKVWALQHAIVDACLRLWPGTDETPGGSG